MSAADPVVIVNQVIILLNRSLSAYLSDAKPWMGRAGNEVGQEIGDVLSAIVDDQNAMADRLAGYVLENRGDVASGEFPMMFTAWHDLSIEFCLKQLVQRQSEAIRFLEQAVAALDRFPLPKALVEEALGAARGHLESLEELTTVNSSTP